MGKKYLIGIDIGTQGVKAAIYDSDGLKYNESYTCLSLITDIDGHIIQNPDEIFNSVINTIKQIVNDRKIAAIGIDGQMTGIMAIDEDWNYVTPYDSWLDTKCGQYITLMKEKAENEIISSTGGQVSCAHGAKILWLKETKPEIYKKVSKFVTLSAYIAGRLCGLKAVNAYTDDTHLHFTGFADNRQRTWNADLLNMFDISKDKMPKIVRPYDVIGEVKETYAKQCGLGNGVYVIAGQGDTMASMLGAGITRPGMIYDVAGTASVFALCTDKYNPDISDKTIIYARTAIEGLWAGYAYIIGGGLCLRWFRDLVKSSYEELDAKASNVLPGSGGIYFIPHFADERGVFYNIGWNHKEEHMYRAVMESIAYEYSLYYEILKSHSSYASAVYGTGGGSCSHIFNGIKADVLGLPYIPLKCPETASLWSAVTAGYGIGVINSIEETINKNCEKAETVNPDMGNCLMYREHVKKYKEYINDMREKVWTDRKK